MPNTGAVIFLFFLLCVKGSGTCSSSHSFFLSLSGKTMEFFTVGCTFCTGDNHGERLTEKKKHQNGNDKKELGRRS